MIPTANPVYPIQECSIVCGVLQHMEPQKRDCVFVLLGKSLPRMPHSFPSSIDRIRSSARSHLLENTLTLISFFCRGRERS